MKYFLDTEFHEDGKTIDLISIALACEDGREYYAVSVEADYQRINQGKTDTCEWLRKNVMPYIREEEKKMRSEIVKDVLDFTKKPDLGKEEYPEFSDEYYQPEFWGYYADYDWVVFCQLFGRMIDLPTGFPMWCHDLKQLSFDTGILLPKQEKDEHHAMADARWIREQTLNLLKQDIF